MRTAAICPTCATYTNAVCVLYDGPYLSNLDINPLTDLEEILGIIDEKIGTLQPLLGFTPENVANKSTNIVTDQSSNTKYPSVKAVYDWVTGNFQPSLGFTPENVANKSTNTSLGTSNTLYPTQNAVKTYVDTAIAAIPTPNLQQVTNAGNTTTNPIVLVATPVGPVSQSVLLTPGSPTGASVKVGGSLISTEITASAITWGLAGSSTVTLVPSVLSPGDVFTITLPAVTGTLVASVNGIVPNASGDVTLPTPTLQEVTVAGNQTNTGIIVDDGTGTDILYLLPGQVKTYYDPSGEFVQIDKNTITFNNGNFDLDVVNPTLTAARTINLPNASGTFALSVNGNAANSSGNVSVNLQSVLNTGNSLSGGRNFQGTNAGVGSIGSEVVGLGTSAGFGNTGSYVFGVGLDAAGGNTGSDVTAFGTGAAQGNTLSGVTVFSNLTLPTYADHAAAVLAITVPLGATPGCTYLYHNQATNSIGAVRL